MLNVTEEFIRLIPKTDLHLHLDGSLRLPTLIEMAKAGNIELPSCEEAGLNEDPHAEGVRCIEVHLPRSCTSPIPPKSRRWCAPSTPGLKTRRSIYSQHEQTVH